jgi:hypothetical protein
MSRVLTVSAIILVFFGTLAGCTGIPSDTESQTTSPVRLEEVYLNNEDSDEHAIDVVIQKNDSVAYWNAVKLNGTDGSENGTQVSYGETIESETIGASPGQYVVFVRLDDRTSGQRFDVNQRAGDCGAVSLQIEIREEGDVVLFRNGSCD